MVGIRSNEIGALASLELAREPSLAQPIPRDPGEIPGPDELAGCSAALAEKKSRDVNDVTSLLLYKRPQSGDYPVGFWNLSRVG